jgi:hypothetical protein
MSNKAHDPEQLVQEKEREQLIGERAYALWRQTVAPVGRLKRVGDRQSTGSKPQRTLLSARKGSSVCDLRLPARRLRRSLERLVSFLPCRYTRLSTDPLRRKRCGSRRPLHGDFERFSLR